MDEKQIKKALISHFARYQRGAGDLVYLEEVQVNGGVVRADLVEVNSMHCYEIKSGLDTLKRLHSQGSRYGKVFDKVTLVIGEGHLPKAMAMAPTWWGIVLIPSPGRKVFRRIRYGRANPRQDKSALATLLGKQEVIGVLEKYGISQGWKSKSLYVLQHKVAEMLPLSILKKEVKTCMLRRVG